MCQNLRATQIITSRSRRCSMPSERSRCPSALDRALLAAPDRVEIYWQKMVFLKKDGHVEDALDLLDRAEKSLPREPSIPVLRAALLESSGRTEQARQLLEDSRRRWPESPAVWVAEGLIPAAHANPEQTRRALDTAVSLGAHSPEVTASLADLKASSPSEQTQLFFSRPPQDW